MNIKFRSIAIVINLMLLSGCVAYAPYPEYYSPAPYGSYGYGIAPVVPVPMFHGGWGRHGGGHGYRHRHH